MKFDELNIDERILRAVEDMGFEETSPIQTQAIPAVLEGIDVIGQAQTGTGKTAAYSIPMLQKINPDVKKPQAIVLCPTRELAVQVAEVFRVGLIHAEAVGDAHGVLCGVDHIVAVQIPLVRGLALVLHGFDLRQLGFGRNLVQLRVVQRHFRELPAALIERLLVLAFA